MAANAKIQESSEQVNPGLLKTKEENPILIETDIRLSIGNQTINISFEELGQLRDKIDEIFEMVTRRSSPAVTDEFTWANTPYVTTAGTTAGTGSGLVWGGTSTVATGQLSDTIASDTNITFATTVSGVDTATIDSFNSIKAS